MLDFLRRLFNHGHVPVDKEQIKDNTVINRLRAVLLQDRLDPSLETIQGIGRPIRIPEVYLPRPGDRLEYAVETPGDAENGVKPATVNQTLRVVHEGHCDLPVLDEPLQVPVAEKELVEQGESIGTSGLIDINLAPTDLLETLPGIGPVTAQAIVDYGHTNGPFQSLEEIMNVLRIGPVTFEKIRVKVTVNPTR